VLDSRAQFTFADTLAAWLDAYAAAAAHMAEASTRQFLALWSDVLHAPASDYDGLSSVPSFATAMAAVTPTASGLSATSPWRWTPNSASRQQEAEGLHAWTAFAPLFWAPFYSWTAWSRTFMGAWSDYLASYSGQRAGDHSATDSMNGSAATFSSYRSAGGYAMGPSSSNKE
jgi:hypothetical protein